MKLEVSKKVRYNGRYIEGAEYLTIGKIYEIYNVFMYNKYEIFYILDDDLEALPVFKEEFSSFDEV